MGCIGPNKYRSDSGGYKDGDSRSLARDESNLRSVTTWTERGTVGNGRMALMAEMFHYSQKYRS
ncbi:MAG: hypothetical protein DMG94_07500 [Acidobacteria bacterium]|nr:MAG: hypothetical protein DMG94_07500 [Acidobacteriota bacterium]